MDIVETIYKVNYSFKSLGKWLATHKRNFVLNSEWNQYRLEFQLKIKRDYYEDGNWFYSICECGSHN